MTNALPQPQLRQFRPSAARNAHLQTIIANTLRRAPVRYHRRERLELDDGDFLDLDWLDHPAARGIAVVFHGLGGNSYAPYVCGAASSLFEAGFSVAAVNFRGCSGEPNRLPRGYHCGATDDALRVVQALRPRTSGPLVAVGFSLGGNVLARAMGEWGDDALVDAAVAVAAPLDLHAAIQTLDRGLSRGYQQFLLVRLKAHLWPKRRILAQAVDMDAAMRCTSFRAFDDLVTAPLHGYDSALDYWTRASARPLLPQVRRPLLLLHAMDDPFMPPSVLPGAGEASEWVTVHTERHGGHVGFLGAGGAGQPVWWLEHELADWLRRACVTPE